MYSYKKIKELRKRSLYRYLDETPYVFKPIARFDVLVALVIYTFTFVVIQSLLYGIIAGIGVLILFPYLRKKYGKHFIITIFYKTIGIYGFINPKSGKKYRG